MYKMRAILKISFLMLLVLVSTGDCRRLSDVQVARELHAQGFPLHEINDWVCLVMGESSGDTSAMNKHNTDGSWDWGLFQINDRYWCSGRGGNNGCNVRCKDLANDDIAAASRCAKQIKSQQGFSAWVAWNNNCQGQLKDYTSYLLQGSGQGSWGTRIEF